MQRKPQKKVILEFELKILETVKKTKKVPVKKNAMKKRKIQFKFLLAILNTKKIIKTFFKHLLKILDVRQKFW